jgi:hypothetical protein
MRFSPKFARFFRRTLLTLAILTTLVAGFYFVEDWRGDRAWRACTARYAARGDPVDFLPAPASLPAATNFMKTPLLDRLLFAQSGSPEMKTFLDNAAQPGPVNSEWRSGRLFDLGQYFARQQEERKRLKLKELPATETPAASVLAAQAPLEPALAELRQAVRERPASQLVRPRPISREEPFNAAIPRFQIPRLLGYALNVQACAMLAAGRAGEAQTDGLAALRFARGFTQMPDALLFEAMIGTVMTNIALQPIWEGCQQHAWSEPQLEQLQHELLQIKPLAALERSMRQERAHFVLTLENISSEEFRKELTSDGRLVCMALAWGPRGWLRQNCLAVVANLQVHMDLLAVRSTPDFLPKLEAQRAAAQASEHWGLYPYTAALEMLVPDYGSVTTHAASAETNVALATIACALERYRLGHGSYPESLTELVPAFLDKVPLDVVDGQPLRYRRTDNGRFTLYSIGLDGKDDGGKPVGHKKTDSAGDWTWPQPIDPEANPR